LLDAVVVDEKELAMRRYLGLLAGGVWTLDLGTLLPPPEPVAISCRAEVDQEAKEKPNPVSTQKSAYVDEDDDNELGDMLFHADVKEADCWSDDHARTVEQHPAIPRSVCDENTGALSATNSFALSPFSSSSANCAAGAAARLFWLQYAPATERNDRGSLLYGQVELAVWTGEPT
jgi:hypothetical protein